MVIKDRPHPARRAAQGPNKSSARSVELVSMVSTMKEDSEIKIATCSLMTANICVVTHIRATDKK